MIHQRGGPSSVLAHIPSKEDDKVGPCGLFGPLLYESDVNGRARDKNEGVIIASP
jgi:hypothetical protein